MNVSDALELLVNERVDRFLTRCLIRARADKTDGRILLRGRKGLWSSQAQNVVFWYGSESTILLDLRLILCERAINRLVDDCDGVRLDYHANDEVVFGITVSLERLTRDEDGAVVIDPPEAWRAQRDVQAALAEHELGGAGDVSESGQEPKQKGILEGSFLWSEDHVFSSKDRRRCLATGKYLERIPEDEIHWFIVQGGGVILAGLSGVQDGWVTKHRGVYLVEITENAYLRLDNRDDGILHVSEHYGSMVLDFDKAVVRPVMAEPQPKTLAEHALEGVEAYMLATSRKRRILESTKSAMLRLTDDLYNADDQRSERILHRMEAVLRRNMKKIHSVERELDRLRAEPAPESRFDFTFLISESVTLLGSGAYLDGIEKGGTFWFQVDADGVILEREEDHYDGMVAKHDGVWTVWIDLESLLRIRRWHPEALNIVDQFEDLAGCAAQAGKPIVLDFDEGIERRFAATGLRDASRLSELTMDEFARRRKRLGIEGSKKDFMLRFTRREIGSIVADTLLE